MGQGSGVAVSCGIGCRRGLDPALLWLWHRLAAAAPIGPLAWESPHAVGVALEKAKRKINKSLLFQAYYLNARGCLSSNKEG